jgi:hypothetical protein
LLLGEFFPNFIVYRSKYLINCDILQGTDISEQLIDNKMVRNRSLSPPTFASDMGAFALSDPEAGSSAHGQMEFGLDEWHQSTIHLG